MISTFFSYEAARRSLAAHQTALNVTGQNVANANTAGYTRQEAVLTALGPAAPSVGPSGAVGMGVDVQLIRQVKDNFLLDQIRHENGIDGDAKMREEILKRVESLLLEPTDNGVRSLLDQFWSGLESLAQDPSSPGARAALIGDGVALTDGVRYLDDQLRFIREGIDSAVSAKVDDANTKIRAIADINRQLMTLETPVVRMNDLRDERERLTQDLARTLGVTTSNSDRLEDGRILLDGRELVTNDRHLELTFDFGTDDSKFRMLRFKDQSDVFSIDPNIVRGFADSRAADGAHSVLVKSLATGLQVENTGLALRKDELLSNVRGIHAGTILINGREISVDPLTTTLADFGRLLNDAGVGVTAEVTDQDRLIIRSVDLGRNAKLTMGDGTSNVLSKLGLVAEVTGTAVPPIRDRNASLNIQGAFLINGKQVIIQQGVTDSLAKIAGEINAGVPEIEASIETDVSGNQQLRLKNRANPLAGNSFTPISLRDLTPNAVLFRLGVQVVPNAPETISGPTVTGGTDAVFRIDNTEYTRTRNSVDDALLGVTLELRSLGRTEIHTNRVVRSGEIGGLLASRDDGVPSIQTQLFDFVKTFVDRINAAHFDGFGLDGTSHRNFFEPLPALLDRNAARSPLAAFKVRDDIVADPRRVAAAGLDATHYLETGEVVSAGPGDNSAALALAELRFQPVFPDGSNLTDRYASIYTDLGIKSAAAKRTSQTESQVLTALDNRRQEVSGVSIDEEMTNLIRFQQGYAAAARVLSTIDQAITDVINRLMR